MKVKEFIRQEIDIDVYDDVCEELAIAFCGPLDLTENGLEKFGDVLEYDVTIAFDDTAIVHVDTPDDPNGWKKRLRKAKQFFDSAAGYCSESDYCRWFKS